MSTLTLPSGIPVDFRPIAAQEDLILRDQKLLRKGLALDRVMAACVTSLDGKEADADRLLALSALDRSVFLLELRKESYGSELSFSHLCVNPTCGTPMDLQFNLDEVKVHQPKTDQPLDLTLPSGAKAKLLQPTGRMEQELVRLEGATDQDFLLKCLETLNSEPPSRVTFQKLSGRDLVVLRKTVKESYGFIDDIALARCKECGTVNRISLMTHPGFLYPEM